MPVIGDLLLVIEDSELVGVRVADGSEAWRSYVPPNDGDRGLPEGPQATDDDVFTDGTLAYIAIETLDHETAGDVTGNIVAVDPATGREVWRSAELGDIGYGAGIADAAPFDEGGAVAFLMEGTPRRIVVLDAATGQQRWEAPIASEYASIVDAAGTTIVADGPDMPPSTARASPRGRCRRRSSPGRPTSSAPVSWSSSRGACSSWATTSSRSIPRPATAS